MALNKSCKATHIFLSLSIDEAIALKRCIGVQYSRETIKELVRQYSIGEDEARLADDMSFEFFESLSRYLEEIGT